MELLAGTLVSVLVAVHHVFRAAEVDKKPITAVNLLRGNDTPILPSPHGVASAPFSLGAKPWIPAHVPESPLTDIRSRICRARSDSSIKASASLEFLGRARQGFANAMPSPQFHFDIASALSLQILLDEGHHPLRLLRVIINVGADGPQGATGMPRRTTQDRTSCIETDTWCSESTRSSSRAGTPPPEPISYFPPWVPPTSTSTPAPRCTPSGPRCCAPSPCAPANRATIRRDSLVAAR